MTPPAEPALPASDGSAKRKRTAKAPKPIKVGAVALPLYHYGDGRWAIIYREAKGAKRKTLSFKSEAQARGEGEKLCNKIANGSLAADHLTADERAQAVAARDLLAPVGLSLDTAAREITEAQRLTGGAGVLEMARFWARHHSAANSGRTPAQIIDEMIAAKKAEGLDAEYLRNVEQPLGKFARAFSGPIGEITAAEIRKYLKDLPVGKRTRNNIRAHLVMLFRFAQESRDIPDDRKNEAEKVGRAKEPRKPPGVYTPAQLSHWLGLVREEWLPWMALGAFAGIRSAEIVRMDWSDILWITKEIYIRPEVAKTGEGRYVPLQDNLAAWLLKQRRGSGPIKPEKGRVNLETARMTAISRKGGGPAWDGNALRHSYGSHRLGIIRDLGTLTVEMGNSIAVNRRNYQNPRSRQECVEFFALMPAGEKKPIPFPVPA